MFLGFNLILNLLATVSLVLLINEIAGVIKRQKDLKHLKGLGLNKPKKEVKNKVLFNGLYSKIEKNLYYKKSGNTSMTAIYFAVTLLIILGLFVTFYAIHKPALYMGIPLITYLFINKYVDITTLNIDVKIQEQLPNIIRNINKNFSRYNDLKTIIYNATLEMEFPLRKEFQTLTNKMLSTNEEKALLEFADKMDNMWVYSLIFILTSYKKESSKENVVMSLRTLVNIIEKENRLEELALTDRKMPIVTNVILAVMAILGLILNLIFNPKASSFFFGTTKGMIMFIVGYSLVLCTFLMNAFIKTKK
jgi:Flp pilus assembly protein TadB